MSPTPNPTKISPNVALKDLKLSSNISLSADLHEAISQLRDMRDQVEVPERLPDANHLAKLSTKSTTSSFTSSPSFQLSEPSVISSKSSDDNDDYVAVDEQGPYCRACGVPLLPDPRPEQLFIWLHAMKYSSPEWDFSSKYLPNWASDNWDGEVVDVL